VATLLTAVASPLEELVIEYCHEMLTGVAFKAMSKLSRLKASIHSHGQVGTATLKAWPLGASVCTDRVPSGAVLLTVVVEWCRCCA